MAKLQDVYAQKRNHCKNELRFEKQSNMVVRHNKRPGTAIRMTNLTETVDESPVRIVGSPKQQTTAQKLVLSDNFASFMQDQHLTPKAKSKIWVRKLSR